MFTFRLKLSKDRVLIALCAALAVASLVWHFFAFSTVLPNGETEANRKEFLEELGYTVTADSTAAKSVFLPEKFDWVYTSYNELQGRAEFDLSRYRGCEARLYTYKLGRIHDLKEATASLLVYRDKIIGGDISSLEKGGVCLPLVSAEENSKELKEQHND